MANSIADWSIDWLIDLDWRLILIDADRDWRLIVIDELVVLTRGFWLKVVSVDRVFKWAEISPF